MNIKNKFDMERPSFSELLEVQLKKLNICCSRADHISLKAMNWEDLDNPNKKYGREEKTQY